MIRKLDKVSYNLLGQPPLAAFTSIFCFSLFVFIISFAISSSSSFNINISRLLEQTIFEFQPSLKKKDLNINLKCPSVCSLLCDGDKIARVFDNLIKNAINYSYPNTTIDFDVKQEEENTTFVITNHGQTIHPDKCKRLFDAFYRGEYARNSETGGSGLGLAICKDIVEHHGGSITVESRDELIIFTVILPNKSTVINSSEFH